MANALALLVGAVPAEAVSGISSGGSIVYVKDWATSPDGALKTRLTFDGTTPSPDGTGNSGYHAPSRSDSGDVMTALRNQTVGQDTEGWVWIMNGQGQAVKKFKHEQRRVDADCMIDFARYPEGLSDVTVSPDGTRVTYTRYVGRLFQQRRGGARQDAQLPGFVADIDGANQVRIEGVGAPSPPTLAWASWASNSRLLLSNKSGDEFWYVDLPGSQAHRWLGNVSDAASYGPYLRAGKLVSHSLRSGGAARLRLWSSNGGPPTAPTKHCDLAVTVGGFDGIFSGPSWASDGNALVWYEGDFTNHGDEPGEGLQVMSVGDPATTACPGGYVRQSLAPGGTEPHWGPAAMRPTITAGDVKITEGDARSRFAYFPVTSRTRPRPP